MKKIFLTAVIGALLTSVAMAQDPKAQDQKVAEQKSVEQKNQKESEQKAQMAKQAEEWEKILKAELKLTDAQLEKYNALNQEFSEKKQAILNDASLTPEAKKEKKTALKKEKEAKLNEILTPEQQAKYKELKESMEKKKEASKPMK